MHVFSCIFLVIYQNIFCSFMFLDFEESFQLVLHLLENYSVIFLCNLCGSVCTPLDPPPSSSTGT